MAAAMSRKVQKAVSAAIALARQSATLPVSRMWLDYDEEADVLYLSFRRPQEATDTVELDDEGMLLRFSGRELVGVTVLDASSR